MEKKLEQLRSPGAADHAIPLAILRNQKTKDQEVDFDQQVHIIAQPYAVQEHRIGGEYGKELVAKAAPVATKPQQQTQNANDSSVLDAVADQTSSTKGKELSVRPKGQATWVPISG